MLDSIDNARAERLANICFVLCFHNPLRDRAGPQGWERPVGELVFKSQGLDIGIIWIITLHSCCPCVTLMAMLLIMQSGVTSNIDGEHRWRMVMVTRDIHLLSLTSLWLIWSHGSNMRKYFWLRLPWEKAARVGIFEIWERQRLSGTQWVR